MSLEILRERYPWPQQKPDRKPDPRGWFDHEAEVVLKQFLNPETKLVVEIGSFLGKSTRFILEAAPNATIIAVDHWKATWKWFIHSWKGNVKERDKFESYIYETFLFNCWEYRDRLIPLKADSTGGLDEIHNLELQPDLIYVDGDHYFEGVLKDIFKSVSYFPEAQIVGDDWEWGPDRNYPVRQAAELIAKDFGYEIELNENTWYYKRKT